MTINKWVENIIKTESPSTSIIAFHFGIFETQIGYTIYLIGSKEYNEDDSDWATNEDFSPKEKYFPLPQEKFAGLEWKEVLLKVERQLSDLINTDENKDSFLDKAQIVTIGFDDGELIRIK